MPWNASSTSQGLRQLIPAGPAACAKLGITDASSAGARALARLPSGAQAGYSNPYMGSSPTASFRRGGHFASASFRGGPCACYPDHNLRSDVLCTFCERTCAAAHCQMLTSPSALAADDELGLGGYQRDLPQHLSHSALKPQVGSMPVWLSLGKLPSYTSCMLHA